ncbi:MAG: hypothetical protein LBK45_06665, partial [Tannerellaceae bacterium]|nr:hypothetical protein [Tannerellaceae bacterium]
MRKTANLSLLLLLGLSFCFTRCKDKDLEVDPPTVFNLQGNWECRDTTIWIGGESPEYNYRTLTFYDTTFEYIIEIEKEDPNDHSATISAIHTIKGVYSIYYPTIRFTPDLQEDY